MDPGRASHPTDTIEGLAPGVSVGLRTVGRNAMGMGDKARHAAEKLSGKGKETAGEGTGDDRLKAQGKGDQAKSDLEQAGEKIKDVFKKKD